MRIDVSGVFSPCETLLTNPAFSLALLGNRCGREVPRHGLDRDRGRVTARLARRHDARADALAGPRLGGVDHHADQRVQPLPVDREHLQLAHLADRPDVEAHAGARPQVAVQERLGADPQTGALETQLVEHARAVLLLLARRGVLRVVAGRFVQAREIRRHLVLGHVSADAVQDPDPAHAQERGRRGRRVPVLEERRGRVQQRQGSAQLVAREREAAGEHQVPLHLGACVELVAAVSAPQFIRLVARGLLGQRDQVGRPPERHLAGRLDAAVGVDEVGVREEPLAGRLRLAAPVGVTPVERGAVRPAGVLAQHGLTPVCDVLLEEILGAAAELAGGLVPLEADRAEAEHGKEDRLEQR
jgi:hypothetical protein